MMRSTFDVCGMKRNALCVGFYCEPKLVTDSSITMNLTRHAITLILEVPYGARLTLSGSGLSTYLAYACSKRIL